VRIVGEKLDGATAVTFERGTADVTSVDCGAQGACKVLDDAHIDVTTPAHDATTVDVRVLTPDGKTQIVRNIGADDDQFTYFPNKNGNTTGDDNNPGGGFTGNDTFTPATPGGFGASPAPATGFSATPGFLPSAVAGPNAVGGVAPGASGSPSAGLVPPAGPPPAAPAGAAPPPDASQAPGAAPHYNMVRNDNEGAAGAMLAGAGALLVLFCFSHARRYPADPAVAPATAHQEA
jgi:hypothetical protein